MRARLVLAAAGLWGAAGVALAAVAAHRVDSPGLATAAQMLMIHATVAVSLIAIAKTSQRAKLWLTLSIAVLASVALFSGDIALNTMAGFHLFPMAAPTGGSLLIASWLAIAISALRE